MVHQISGGQWFDRTPASPEADSAGRLAHAGGRVFTVLSSSNPITLDVVYSDTDGEWLPIDHGFEWIDHLMATDPEQLWLTGYVSEPEGNQLFGWDGSNRFAAGPDGLIIHDGLRRWRFEFCPE